MNETDKYFFLLLVNSTNKNQKISLLKSINTSQYKIIKEITLKILNEILPIDKKQFRKFSKNKTFIRKLGNRKVSGQLLGKNYSVVIDIIHIGLKYNEICTEIYPSSKRRMGKNKSSSKKHQTITYSKNREKYFSSESNSQEFSSEEISSEEISSEETSNDEREYSSSGQEFRRESSEDSSNGDEEEEKKSMEKESTENSQSEESIEEKDNA